ncbi:MAG: pyridoxine 5'-phosphate synthase [Planctomycetota bacterium]|nr:MAG: pyridoxine 5'-phosphate synthase [Planctomycetota bacterium]
MKTLGVNIDHVATIRQARKTIEPEPATAAALAEMGGADGITIHLREDRRHIQDYDLDVLKRTIKSRLNLEMALSEGVIKKALEIEPEQITIVPEKREEVTTEGGLDVVRGFDQLKKVILQFQDKGIYVSLFIDPEPDQIKASADLGVEFIELHTGHYANASMRERHIPQKQLFDGASQAINLGLRVNAGHGLTYHNVQEILTMEGLEELNIGHSIIARAVFVGLKEAVREMKNIIIHNN